LNQVIYESGGDDKAPDRKWNLLTEKVKLTNLTGVKNDKGNVESCDDIVYSDVVTKYIVGEGSTNSYLGRDYNLCSVIWNNSTNGYCFFSVVVIGFLNILVNGVFVLRRTMID
jgi:hypothetical protein